MGRAQLAAMICKREEEIIHNCVVVRIFYEHHFFLVYTKIRCESLLKQYL